MARTIILPLLLCLASCEGCLRDRSDAFEIHEAPIDLEVKRLDQHLFHHHPDSMHVVHRMALERFGTFYRVYVEDILQGVPLEDERLPLFLQRFVTDEDWSTVQQAIDSVFPDMRTEERLLRSAYGRLRTAFPDSVTPQVVTYNSGYNYGIYPTDSILGIGLEWFIGRDHPVVEILAPEAFPGFVKDRMRPEMLVPSAVKGWLLVHFMPDLRGADVLTNLIETGKVMVLLDALLPEVEPHLKFAFTREQLAWCEANEFNIWKDIVEHDKLYSKKPADIGQLMNDGPFTSGFPRESPGHIGEWIGYRMVLSYLQADPRIEFEQLFHLQEPREILKHYKPR